jgi:hypothetical protein
MKRTEPVHSELLHQQSRNFSPVHLGHESQSLTQFTARGIGINGADSFDMPFYVFTRKAPLYSDTFEGLKSAGEIKTALKNFAEPKQALLILLADQFEKRPFPFRNVKTI